MSLIERLESGKTACPALEPTLSHRPMTLEEWREAGTEAAARIRELVEALEETNTDLCNLQCRKPASPEGKDHTPGCRRADAVLAKVSQP